jgi:hypothetical protein
VESFKKHAFNSELKEESVGDLVAEIIFKKLVEQSGLNPDATTPNQTPALPSEQPSTKKQKYIT